MSPGGSRLGGPGLQRAWYGVARAVVAGVCRAYWGVEVRGRQHVPATGPFVLAPVHRSNIDTLLCGCVTTRPLRFMGKDSLWRRRWSAAFFTSLGGFPVHRGVPDREALRTCQETLAAGGGVVLFPEGTRQSGPVVQPVLEGAVWLAARAGAPIVPVGIGGSEQAMPKGSSRVRPVKVVLVVGPPIPPPARPDGGRLPRRELTEVSARLRGELQRLFDEAGAAASAPGWRARRAGRDGGR